MKVILVEDEVLAMQKLERYILKYDATIDICARLTSISETVSWIKNSKNVYDLVFYGHTTYGWFKFRNF